MNFQQILILAGFVLIVLGVLWPFLSHLELGRLPGDIVIERKNVRFSFPLVTCLLISFILSLLLWIFRK